MTLERKIEEKKSRKERKKKRKKERKERKKKQEKGKKRTKEKASSFLGQSGKLNVVVVRTYVLLPRSLHEAKKGRKTRRKERKSFPFLFLSFL